MKKEALLGADYRYGEARPPVSMSAPQKEAWELFLKDIHARGKYVDLTECPFCKAAEFTKISERDARGLPCEVAVCDVCGGCFKSKILDPEANRYLYEKVSYILRGKYRSPGAVEALFRKRVKEFAYPRYGFIRHFAELEQDMDLIAEFGCGDGANLVPWRDDGFSVIGIEFDAVMVEFGKSKGLDLVQGDFMTHDLGGARPKLVILSHLLEHVTDIDAVLSRIHSVLDPYGYLFIEVPGVKGQGLGRPLSSFDAEHNYYFDLECLSSALRKNRFSVAYGDEYIRVLCRPVEAPIAEPRNKKAGARRILDLFRKEESGSLMAKAKNTLTGAYFRAYYSILSSGVGHGKA